MSAVVKAVSRSLSLGTANPVQPSSSNRELEFRHRLFVTCLRHKKVERVLLYRTAADLSRGASPMLGWLGLSLALGGQDAEARTLLDCLHERATNARAAHQHRVDTSRPAGDRQRLRMARSRGRGP